MSTPHRPPFTITPRILGHVAACCERVGSWRGGEGLALSPQLRRENRIRSIQASLAIENNSLSIDQVTAILEGRRVMGLPREIQEVKNAIACYDQLASFDTSSAPDFLKAHGLMMMALADDAGNFRRGGVGIYRGNQLIHMAPPADRVPYLIDDLFAWFASTDLHPLIASSILHYEIEFIHPFSDGNGRMGRLWQSLALARWHPELAYLPVESVIRERQTAYYNALGASDRAAEATPFIELILDAITESLDSRTKSDPASDPASDPVSRLLALFKSNESLSFQTMMERMQLRHRTYFRRTFLSPALAAKRLEMTLPETPRHPSQRYRLRVGVIKQGDHHIIVQEDNES